MTTLKNYHGEDIAAAMFETLADENFTGLYRKAALNKEAVGITLEMVKSKLEYARDNYKKLNMNSAKDAISNAWNQLEPAILKQENQQPGFLGQAERVRQEVSVGGKGPGGYVPGQGPMADDKKDPRKLPILNTQDPIEGIPPMDIEKEFGIKNNQKAKDDNHSCPACDGASDAHLALAMDFTIGQLNKLANALDRAGFPGVAGYIDTTSQNLANNRPKVSEAAKNKVKEDKKKEKEMKAKERAKAKAKAEKEKEAAKKAKEKEAARKAKEKEAARKAREKAKAEAEKAKAKARAEKAKKAKK